MAVAQDYAKQEDIESKGPVTAQIDDTSVTSNVNILEKRSYVSSLRLFSGVYTKESLWKLFVRPVAFSILPQVLWATLVMSGTIGFLVAISSNFAPAFETAYGFKPWQSGLCFIAALIGALIGIFVGGHFSDWIADRQTQRNGGVREPEMRLPAILVSAITAPLALVLYGVGIQYKLHWIYPTIALDLSKYFPLSHLTETDNRSQLLHRSSNQRLACVHCRLLPTCSRRDCGDTDGVKICIRLPAVFLHKPLGEQVRLPERLRRHGRHLWWSHRVGRVILRLGR